MYLLIYVHACVYCVPRGVKRPDIVKEILMFALWSLESKEPTMYKLMQMMSGTKESIKIS